MGRNVEVDVISKCRIDSFGVFAPFPLALEEEYVVFEE